MVDCKTFSKIILKWSNKNPRNLPWDEYNDPYQVWATEIMLQQTSVAQATDYINKFFQTFSSLKKLADAEEEEVLKLWEGLGYYARARNLHFTAKYIQNELKGVFPKSYTELLKLKGVGPYTAAAIASFCYKEPIAVLDGNVIRVLSRFHNIKEPVNENQTLKHLKALAQDSINTHQPDAYNQAIMNFGATHCTPVNPKCSSCPLVKHCEANENNTVSQIPFKSKKIKKRKRYFNFLIIHQEKDIYIQKREDQDIWKHLWQFPLIETDEFISEKDLKRQISKTLGGINFKMLEGSKINKQILTHQIIHAKFHLIRLKNAPVGSLNRYKRINISKLSDYPSPRIMTSFLSNNNLSLVIQY